MTKKLQKNNLELTERQKKIVKYLVELFVETGQEVSSFDLMKRYQLPFSSATLRAEFLTLTKKGYLTKQHFASGRIPTVKGLALYISELMEEQAPDFFDVVKISQILFNHRFNVQFVLRQSMKVLYNWVRAPVFVLYNDSVQFYRLSQLLNRKNLLHKKRQEAYIQGLIKLFDIIEDPETLYKLFVYNNKIIFNSVKLLAGQDLGWDNMQDFIILYSSFKLLYRDEKLGFIGVVGSIDIDYPQVVPSIKTISEILNNLLKGW